MEVYKTLTEAINSIDPQIIYWEYPDSDEIYDRNALLNIADQLEPIFDPEGLNYYMPFTDGEIKLLLMREGQIMTIFVPRDMPADWKEKAVEQVVAPPVAEVKETVSAPTPAPEEAKQASPAPQEKQAVPAPAGPKFCPKCGAPVKPGAGFCGKCGYRLKQHA